MKQSAGWNVGQMSYRVVSEDAYDEITELAENTDKAVSKALQQMGRQLKSKIFRSIKNTPRIGNVYYWQGEKRRRSAPYNSHADQSKALRKSLSYKVSGLKGLEIGYGLTRWYGNADEYAERIELGGEDRLGRVIDPRPSIHDNVETASFEDFFDSEMKKL